VPGRHQFSPSNAASGDFYGGRFGVFHAAARPACGNFEVLPNARLSFSSFWSLPVAAVAATGAAAGWSAAWVCNAGRGQPGWGAADNAVEQ